MIAVAASLAVSPLVSLSLSVFASAADEYGPIQALPVELIAALDRTFGLTTALVVQSLVILIGIGGICYAAGVGNDRRAARDEMRLIAFTEANALAQGRGGASSTDVQAIRDWLGLGQGAGSTQSVRKGKHSAANASRAWPIP